MPRLCRGLNIKKDMTGRDLIVVLYQNNVALASTAIRSHDIQTKAGVNEKASATQQDWKEHLAGRKEWSLTVNYLVLAATKITDLLYVGQTFGITIRDRENTVSITGRAIMTGVKQVANINSLVTGSFSFIGTGPLQ